MDLALGILFTVVVLTLLGFLASRPDPRDLTNWQDPRNWL